MKNEVLGVLSVVYVVASLTPLWAGPVGMQRTLSPDQKAVAVQQLQAQEEELGRQLPEPPKGPALIRYMSKRSQLEDLINRIQSGQSVAPNEIDQALQPTYR